MKYFFLGAMSAAFFLYGFAMLYAATGTIEFGHLQDVRGAQMDDGGLSTIWPSEACCSRSSGQPTSLLRPPCISTRRTSTRSGRAGDGIPWLRPQGRGGSGDHDDPRGDRCRWGMAARLPGPVLMMLWVIGVDNDIGEHWCASAEVPKRMLAYSSIAHSGYILIGIIAGPGLGYNAVVLYLMTYGVGNTAPSVCSPVFSDVGRNSRRSTISPDCVNAIQPWRPFLAFPRVHCWDSRRCSDSGASCCCSSRASRPDIWFSS